MLDVANVYPFFFESDYLYVKQNYYYINQAKIWCNGHGLDQRNGHHFEILILYKIYKLSFPGIYIVKIEYKTKISAEKNEAKKIKIIFWVKLMMFH